MHTYETSGINIVFEVFDGEVVAVNLDTGKYYSIRHTGAYVWLALMSGNSHEQIETSLIAQHPQDEHAIRSDISAFISKLLGEGLIKGSAPGKSDAGLVAAPSGSYQAPSVEIYSDMQEILLLDPVHDVDESGWPKAQK